MRIGLIGDGRRAAARAEALAGWPGGEVERLPAEAADDLPDGLGVLFIAVPTGDHYRVARLAAHRGVHVFLEWPPATSVREGEALVRLAEEAGVEAGVSRPLRFHPLFDAVPAGWRAGVIVLRRAEAGPPGDGRPLADAVDLCCALARSSSVRRVDAEAVRGAGAWPEVSAFGLRFHSGTYAQASLRRIGDGPAEHHLFAAGPGLSLEADLAASHVRVRRTGAEGEAVENEAPGEALETRLLDPARLLEAETHAFLAALAERRAAPVSVLDGLHTMRLVERLMDRLR